MRYVANMNKIERVVKMQKIVEFRVNDGDISTQLQDYLDDNSTESFVSIAAVKNGGDELIVAVVNDGE